MQSPRLSLLLSLALLLGSAHAREFRAVLLHSNDVHGQLFPTSPPENLGGLARLATLVARERAAAAEQGAQVLLLDAGDRNTGTFESDQQKGLLDLRAMGRLGYDAMTVGNHEFDLPFLDLHRFRRAATFPLLSANIRTREGRRLFRPYILRKLGDTRVAVVGLTTADTPEVSTYGREYPWRFTDPSVELGDVLLELEDRADFVVILSHLGQPEDHALMRRFQGRFQAWIGGHTHAQEFLQLDPWTAYSRTGSRGRFLGRMELTFHEGRPAGRDPRVIPVDSSLPEASWMVDLLPEASPGEVVARASSRISDEPEGHAACSSPLGNLFTDAMRRSTGVDVAVANNGGLRRALEAGPITDKQVYAVAPFKNSAFLYRLPGAQLEKLFRQCVAISPGGSSFLEVSGARIRARGGELSVEVHGIPLDPEREYTLAVPDFIAKGGDGYTIFQTFPSPYERRPEYPADLLEAHLRHLGTVHPDPSRRFLVEP